MLLDCMYCVSYGGTISDSCFSNPLYKLLASYYTEHSATKLTMTLLKQHRKRAIYDGSPKYKDPNNARSPLVGIGKAFSLLSTYT